MRASESGRAFASISLALFIEAFSESMMKNMGAVAVGEGGYWDSVLWPRAVAYFRTSRILGIPEHRCRCLLRDGRLLYRWCGAEAEGWTARRSSRAGAARVPPHRHCLACSASSRREHRAAFVRHPPPPAPLVALSFSMRCASGGPRVGRHRVHRCGRRASLVVVYVYFASPARGITGCREAGVVHDHSIPCSSSRADDPPRARARAANDEGRGRALLVGAPIMPASSQQPTPRLVSLAAAPLVIYCLKPSKRERGPPPPPPLERTGDGECPTHAPHFRLLAFRAGNDEPAARGLTERGVGC